MQRNVELHVSELSSDELEQVSGAWIVNVMGAFAGAVGGVYGAAIAAGGGASSKSLWSAGLVGASTGFFNPVGSVGRLAGSIGLGVAGGAIGNAVDSQYDDTTEE